jgi:hypothetical protein
VTLADAPNARGGSWGDDNIIVFQPVSNPGSSLVRVPAGGGTTSPLSKSVPGDILHRWPQALPGARGVLFTASSPANFNDAEIVVQPLPDGEPKVVHRAAITHATCRADIWSTSTRARCSQRHSTSTVGR